MSDKTPWSPNEEVYLLQGLVKNYGDFHTIKSSFPFEPYRTATDLSDKWHDMSEQIDDEEKEIISKFKQHSSMLSRPAMFSYSQKISYSTPNASSFESEFRDLPSLSQRTYSTESGTHISVNESNDLLDITLNTHFDTQKVLNIVKNGLAKIVADEELQNTLIQEFNKSISNKGRQIAIDDLSRRMKIINESRESDFVEKECQYVQYQYNKIFEYAKFKVNHSIRRSPNNVQYIEKNECNEGFSVVYAIVDKIQWPVMDKSPLITLKKDFHSVFVSTITQMINIVASDQEILKTLIKYFQWIASMDPEETIDSQIRPPAHTLFLKARQNLKA